MAPVVTRALEALEPLAAHVSSLIDVLHSISGACASDPASLSVHVDAAAKLALQLSQSIPSLPDSDVLLITNHLCAVLSACLFSPGKLSARKGLLRALRSFPLDLALKQLQSCSEVHLAQISVCSSVCEHSQCLERFAVQ